MVSFASEHETAERVASFELDEDSEIEALTQARRVAHAAETISDREEAR